MISHSLLPLSPTEAPLVWLIHECRFHSFITNGNIIIPFYDVRACTHTSTTPTVHNPTDFRARQMFDREMYFERSYRLFNDLFEHCRSKDQKNSRERRHSITDDTQSGKKKVGSVCGDEREYWKSDGKRQKRSDYTTDGKRYGIRSEKGGQNGMRSEVKKEQWRLVLKSDGTILLGKYAEILGFYSRVGLRK